MRILYCYILDKRDGGMIHANEFINAYKKLGNEIHVVGQNVSYLPAIFTKLKYIKLALARLIWIAVNIIYCLKVLSGVITVRPEAIVIRHAPNHTTLLAQIISSLFCPILLEVNAVNEIEGGISVSSFKRKLDKIAINNAKRIFVVAEPIMNFLVDNQYCDRNVISIIENGVDEEKFSPDNYSSDLRSELGIANDVFIIGFVGSMKKWHGVSNILNVAKKCHLRLGNHVFLIVGDGELRSAYELEAIENNLGEIVRFIGRIKHEDIPKYLSIMDVVLSLHYKQPDDSTIQFHGSPLKIFEYMAMARPIIASPVGQIAEVIEHGKSGFLIDGEASDDICSELVKLETNIDYRLTMGASARSRVISKYTWKINARKVRDLCRDML
jgi:glycosyltransferase involved in cell wall biosynthesis